MDQAKHTPGPWRNHGQYNLLRDEIGAEGRAICTVWTRKAGDGLLDRQEPQAWPEGEANAYLIAAAPELLELLQRYVHMDREADKARGNTLLQESGLHRAAVAAIAKATGGAA